MNLAAKVLKAELDPKPSRLFKAVQMRYGKIKLMKCLHGMKKILLTLMVFASFGAFAVDKLETTQASNPILIDVRTDAEWNDGYIETAIHIPLDKILQKIEFATDNKEQTIYLYCRSGKRSAKAEKVLQSIGYINAKNIGGIKQASSSLQLKITNE